MGCGACVESNATLQPVSARQPTAVLTRHIAHYLTETSEITHNKLTKVHPVVSVEQCKQLQSFLASTNGQLPEITNSKMESNQQFQAANAPSARPLLSQVQRIVWKCLVILPELEEGNIDMVPLYREWIPDEDEIVKESFHQVALDVNRTFPSLKELDRAALTSLLRNVVNCLPEIGYTQGMNFYCGFMLLCGFTPRQSYYLIICFFLSPTFLLALNFNSAFSQVLTCNHLLADNLSKELSSHLQQLGISEDIYCFSWFLCSFLYTLTPQSCAMLWDHMIKSGACGDPAGGFLAILNFSLIIMEDLEQDLLQANSPQKLLEILRSQSLKQIVNQKKAKDLINKLKKKSTEISKEKVITKKHMMDHNIELRTLATRENYKKYIERICCGDRKKGTAKEDEIKVVPIGNTQVIEVKAHEK